MPSNDIISMGTDKLPEYLAGLGLKPQQMVAVLYGLFKEVRQLGTLSPSEDNTIHITKEKLLKMSKDTALESSLYALYSKIQKAKNLDVIFQKEHYTASLSSPDLWHNPNRGPKISTENVKIEEPVEILDFVRFIGACGIDPALVKKAMEERMLLK
ncbi:MAG: hypothetical protein WC624_07065, partial [Candidatus Margulisiibacteriota bacterium]